MSDAKQQAFLEELTNQLQAASGGRLDVRVEVRGDETGPLADAVNHALGSFRGLVLEFRGGTDQLLQSVERVRERAAALGDATGDARSQLGEATATSQELLSSVQRAQSSAEQCRDVAARSLDVVREARAGTQHAVGEMEQVRGSMRDTGKRLKRLAESCQEVGEAVRVIDDVADQTGVLAVNAAIQSSVAGDGADGFAIIVEEIRRLSERARAATRDMESLVRSLQSDSAEAVKAAEQAIAGLVAAGEASARGDTTLHKAEQVSQSLASAVDGIASTMSRQGQRTEAMVRDLNAAERSTGSLQGDSLAVGVALEQVAEVASALHRAQKPFQVAEVDSSSDSVRPTTTGGTIVLKPAQLKGAKGSWSNS